MSSEKAQRVSYSTSHSEIKPAVSCMATSTLIASRISELYFFATHGRHIKVRDLITMHAQCNNNAVPVDMCTDAMNLFELAVHKKALPNDSITEEEF